MMVILINFYELLFDNGYGICIKGIRQPSISEANKFCEQDIKKSDAKEVVSVDPISHTEAYAFYDMSNEKNFPVFGRE